MKKELLNVKVKSTLVSKLAITLGFVFMGVVVYGQTSPVTGDYRNNATTTSFNTTSFWQTYNGSSWVSAVTGPLGAANTSTLAKATANLTSGQGTSGTPITITPTTVNGGTTPLIAVGQVVTGIGITPGTTVSTYTSSTGAMTLSQNAASTKSSASLLFSWGASSGTLTSMTANGTASSSINIVIPSTTTSTPSSFSSGASSITVGTGNASIVSGMLVVGAGIPSNTYVAGYTSGTGALSLSQNTNGSNSGNLSFYAATLTGIASNQIVTGGSISGYATVTSATFTTSNLTVAATLGTSSSTPASPGTSAVTFSQPNVVGSTTNGSNTITLNTTNNIVAVGQTVNGTGVGFGTVVTSVSLVNSNTQTQVTLSANASSSNSNTAYTFGYLNIPNLYINFNVTGSTANCFSTIGNVWVNFSSDGTNGTYAGSGSSAGLYQNNTAVSFGLGSTSTSTFSTSFIAKTLNIASGSTVITTNNTTNTAGTAAATNNLYLLGGAGGNIINNNGSIDLTRTTGGNSLTNLTVYSYDGSNLSTSLSNAITTTIVGTSGTASATAGAFSLAGVTINTPGLSTISLGSGIYNFTLSTLNLTKGLLALGSNSITPSSISGSPWGATNYNYIDASGTGKLTVNSVPATGTTFPIGTSSYYLPLVFTGTNNTPNITVGVSTSFTNAPLVANNVVNAQWSILSSTSSSSTITFQYNSGNKGSGFTGTNPVFGTFTANPYSETALGTVSGSGPYTVATTSAIALATTSASLYGIGNASSFYGGTPTISVTVGSYTYNGSGQGPTAVTGNSGNGAVTWSYVGTSGTSYGPSATLPTNAGSYTATASVAATANYASASSSATAFTIGKATLTVTSGITANNKSYDGTNIASFTIGGSPVLSGYQNGDSYGSSGVTISAVAGTFASVGVPQSTTSGISVTISSITLAGTKGGNYQITSFPTGLTANITPTTSPTLFNTSLSAFSNTVINTTSSPNSFTLSGVNLDGSNVTVTAPSGFTVSLSNSSSGSSSLTLTSYAGTGTTIYVYFSPTTATSYSGNISIAGGSATTITVAASGTGVPGTASGLSIQTNNSTSQQLSWTSPTSGSYDKVLVFASTSSSSYAPSGAGSSYSNANAAIGSAGTYGSSPTNYLVYAGTGNSVTVTGLTSGSTYYYQLIPYSGSSYSAAISTNGTTLAVPGTPTGVSASNGYNNSAIVTFTAPASNGGSAITGYIVTPYIGATAQTTTSGTTSPITVNGLTAGTAYTFKVVATNAVGNSAFSTASSSVTPSGPYTWTGGYSAASTDFQQPTNWSPTRTTPATTDILLFDGNSTPTVTLTNIPTQQISRLLLSNNAQVSLQETSGTSAILTVGTSTVHTLGLGDEISVPSGCGLTLAQNASGGSEIITLQLVGTVFGVTSNISGTLTIAQNTLTTYANVYNAANGVTTVYGTGVINYAGSVGSSTATSLVFKNGSTIVNQRADANFGFSSSYGTTSTERVNVTFSGSNCGTSSSGQIPILNLPAFIGTLTVNTTSATGTMNVRGVSGGSGTSQVVDITTLIVSSTGTGSFGFGSNTTAISTVNVGTGGITVTGGKLNLAYNIGQTITVNGDINISNSSTISLCGSGSNTTYTASLIVKNFNLTSSSTFKLNANGGSATLQTNFPTSILTVQGNFSVDATSTFFNQVSAAPNSIVMNGSAPQTFTASGTFTNVDATQLEINNTATSTVTLNSAMPTIGTLKLTKGQLVLSSNSLITAAVSGGSSTAYVNASGIGRLTILAVPISATTFPIGTATSYAPVTLTGGSAGADISMGVKSTFTHTPNVPNNVVNLEWAMLVGNSISTTPTVKFQYNANTDPASGYSSTGAILGTYEAGSYTESTSGFTINATTPTATTATIAFTNDLPTSTEDYYGIGNPNSFAVSGLPSPPTIGTATISGSNVSVTFTPPADAVATGVTGYLVTSSPGGITATGTSSPISISGLGGGTSYTFTVKSVNTYGNSAASAASNSITTPVYTYTWTGATSTNYQTAANWTPNRTTPTTTDKLQFNSNATVQNVPTQTIGRLTLSNNASVSLQETNGTSATLTVGNTTTHTNGIDDISVPAGCTLTMAANASGGTEFLTLQLASGVTGVTANIAGTLTMLSNATLAYSNTYNAANGVTTISGTVNYAGGFSNISSTSLLFTSNSTLNNQRGDATFPAAFAGTYTRVNVSITGATSSSQVPVSNFPASVNTLTVNDAGVTGSGVLLIRSISGGSGTAQVADITNLTVINGILGFGNNATTVATVTIGSGGINVSGGKLYLAYNSAQTITVAGGINLSGTGVISMCNSGGSAFAATLTTTNFTQTGSSTFYVNGYFGSAPLPSATMNVTGNFSVGSGSLFSQASGVSGTLIFNSTNAAQTISSAGTISNISTVQINNTAASPNNTITLGSAFTIPNALTLTSGTIALGGNTLTVKGTLTNNTTISGAGAVTLNSGATQSIAGTGGTISNLTISNSSTVATISGTQNITGTLTVSTGATLDMGTGKVTLKSTSISNSAIVGNGGGTIKGTATVERYIPMGYRAYRDMAPEVYNAGSIYSNWQEGGSTPASTGIFITGPTATAATVGFPGTPVSATSPNPAPSSGSSYLDYSINGIYSSFLYNNISQLAQNGNTYIGWGASSNTSAITNTNTTLLDAFRGYRVLIRGARDFNLFNTPIVIYPAGLRMNGATTLRATGNLVYGTVTYSTSGVTATVNGNASTTLSTAAALNPVANSFSMVANPYVSPVLWGDASSTSNTNTNTVFGNSTGINGSYWYLDPTNGASGKYFAYNAYSGSSNSSSTATLGYTYNPRYSNAAGYIQPGQAFFVENGSGSSPTVKFTESTKGTTANLASVFGVTKPLSKLYVSLEKQETGVYSQVDGTAVAFASSFGNTAYGPQDARKVSGANDNLYISDKGMNLSIDGRLPATASDAIALKISKPSSKDYQLKVDATDYINEGYTPLLFDALKNTTTAIATVDSFKFTVDTANKATYESRFTILFTPSALPVNSIVASASLNNKIATITWNTVGEKNVSRYEVEKSADAKTFTKIGQAIAKNTATANYSTTENNVTATTYYRIKAVSTSGSISYSNVAKVQLAVNSNQFAVYPNPLVGKTLNVSLSGVNDGKYTVSIYNVLGEKVSEQSINHAGGSASHAITISNTLARGTYSVVVREAASNKQVYQTNLSVQP